MSNLITNVFGRVWPKKDKNSYRALIAGLDFAGKTTFLYKLKLGEIVNTIPTIGFNVESVPLYSGPRSRPPIEVICWELGGCDKIRPLTRHYTSGMDMVIWIVDCNDRSRLKESVFELDLVANHMDVVEDAPILILANKQDMTNALSVQDVLLAVKDICKGRLWNVFPISCYRPLDESGIPSAFSWLTSALEIRDSTARGQNHKSASSTEPSQTDIEKKLTSFLSRAEDDSPPPVFLRQFHEYDLPSWDHYTHIRLAYLILVTHGRQKGKDMIFDGIKNYIAKSKQTTGRSFHLTMTYFWIQMVHFGIQSMPTAPPQPDTAIEKEMKSDDASMITLRDPVDEFVLVKDSGASVTTLAEPSASNEGDLDFRRFLLLNPYVVDGNLWADYYSKDVMMTPKAQEGFVLPDKMNLPNLVARDSVAKKM
ncbi:Arf-domain-containing protein [Rickenella mellea]|uniref:ADP-ribosylation factor n=1 Tax=Rickenella mellea TaxID=50990 RepID=A0A4Y7Q7Y9_9AGAM|nr:Arf-domain-containing protein [Rickenella mellea]